MPEITAVMTDLPDGTECHCSDCSYKPDVRYPEYGGIVRQIRTNADGSSAGGDRWWCEWCLSCGCHVHKSPVGSFTAGVLVPACSMARFGFTDGSEDCRCSPDEGITCSGPNYCPGILERDDPAKQRDDDDDPFAPRAYRAVVCEFCGTEYQIVPETRFNVPFGDHRPNFHVVPDCTCQQDLRGRIEGVE